RELGEDRAPGGQQGQGRHARPFHQRLPDGGRADRARPQGRHHGAAPHDAAADRLRALRASSRTAHGHTIDGERRMTQLTASDLMSLEQYARERASFRAKVLAHKKTRQVALGPNATLYFEDGLTIQ